MTLDSVLMLTIFNTKPIPKMTKMLREMITLPREAQSTMEIVNRKKAILLLRLI